MPYIGDLTGVYQLFAIWASALHWHHMGIGASKSLVNQLFVQQLFGLTTNKKLKLCITDPLWRESKGNLRVSVCEILKRSRCPENLLEFQLGGLGNPEVCPCHEVIMDHFWNKQAFHALMAHPVCAGHYMPIRSHLIPWVMIPVWAAINMH